MEQDVMMEGIRAVVAQRARELGGGGLVGPDDVAVNLDEGESAPGCRLFTATWGAGRHAGALSGLLRDNDPPETRPGQALAKLLKRWGESGPQPAPAAVTAAAATLFDPERRREPVLGPADLQDQPGAELPALLGSSPLDGVRFWWSDGFRPSRVTLAADGAGGVTVTEDMPGRAGGTP